MICSRAELRQTLEALADAVVEDNIGGKGEASVQTSAQMDIQPQ